MKEKFAAYIPMDRRHAMSRSQRLADRTQGAALFADISGFTRLTDALVLELGAQRGAEELTNYLNLVYDAVIDEVHHYGGSVIAFAGDAITCWLEGDDGRRAVSCALAMQHAIVQFATIPTPAGGTVSLSMKAAVSAGPVRRFVVGDPEIRLLDALAGETLVRLAETEHLANSGEVLIDGLTLQALQPPLLISESRRDPESALVAGVVSPESILAPRSPWPRLDVDAIDM